MMMCLWCGREELPKIRLIDIVGLSKINREILCSHCKKQLSSLENQSTCTGCGRLWEAKEFCKDCVRWKELYPNYDFHNEALYEYNAFIKEWIENYKFKGDYRLGNLFTKPLKEKLDLKIKQGWIIVPIPISQKSRDTRGFNQVEGLLSFAGNSFNDVLTHIGEGEKQSSKNRRQRMTSSQPFQLKTSKKINIETKNILLVDDVYTTGRTLFHAAECLLLNGADKVQSLTIAR